MRHAPIVRVEKWRVRHGPMASTTEMGNYGAFMVSYGKDTLGVVVSASWTSDESPSGEAVPWEHVSVSLPHRTPTWEEMCFVKDLFFRDDEVVVQFHPRKKDYVNHHPYCLHLWRFIGGEFPLPDPILVGPKDDPN